MVEIYIARLKKMNKGKTWDGKKTLSFLNSVTFPLQDTLLLLDWRMILLYTLLAHRYLNKLVRSCFSHMTVRTGLKSKDSVENRLWMLNCFCSLPYSHLKIFKSLQQLLFVSEVRWPMIQESAFRVPARSTMYPHTWLMVAVNGTTGTADADAPSSCSKQERHVPIIPDIRKQLVFPRQIATTSLQQDIMVWPAGGKKRSYSLSLPCPRKRT